MQSPAVAPALAADAALVLMARWKVRHLPVVESGQCVGLVSLSEIAASRPSQCPTVPVVVGELCRRPPPVVQSRAGTAAAMQVMKDMNSDAVVVLAGVQVLGIMTKTSTATSFVANANLSDMNVRNQ